MKWNNILPVLLIGIFTYQSFAHQREPKTQREIENFQNQQRSIYHCYPIISHQLTERKTKWLRSHQINPQQYSSIDSDNPKYETLSFGNAQQPVQSQSVGGQTTHQQVFTDDEKDDEGYGLYSDHSTLDCVNSNQYDHHQLRNRTCVFSPIVTTGPYYHESGHPIRQNLAEWQDGLPLLMDIGVIDVETCEPIEGALVDVWHANATGFYAGHPEPKPELIREEPQVGGERSGLLTAYPRSNFHEQWLRGAWPTNSKGVAHFSSIFPGYYTGRATHVHAKVHLNWQINPNATFQSPHSQYTGQFFFEDEINLSVDQMSPYRYNPVKHRTRNWRDSLNVFGHSHHNSFGPIFEIEKLGSVIGHGLVGFITVGINRTATYSHDWSP